MKPSIAATHRRCRRESGAPSRVGQVLVQELGGFGEDQVGPVELSAVGLVATRGCSRLLDVRCHAAE